MLPCIENPAPGSPGSPAAAQQETRCLSGGKRARPVAALSALTLLLLVSCAALSVLYNGESDGTPDWKSFSEPQNMSGGCLTPSKDLKRESEILKKLRAETTLLNRTSAALRAVNLALTLENSELTERLLNLTSTNSQLTQEHEQLVRKQLNMSDTIGRLLGSSSQQQEEQQRLSDVNGLLRDELFQMKETNQGLAEIGGRFRAVSDRATELQEQNQNLSAVLVKERQEAAEQRRSSIEEMEQMVTDMHLMNEAYYSLDVYCPVVNQKTRERICKKCDDSWNQFQTKCYYLSSRTLTWSTSRAWCQAQGGDLLIVNSEEEQRFVFDASRARGQSGARLWVGLTDSEEEGAWRWVDGSKVASHVQYWLSRAGAGPEPDDWKLDDPLGEDCGHIDMSENPLGCWMDGSCETPYRWVCEKNI